MPHLSPMKWCMMLIMFWLIMSMMSSSNWWLQSTSWQNLTSSTKKNQHPWKW